MRQFSKSVTGRLLISAMMVAALVLLCPKQIRAAQTEQAGAEETEQPLASQAIGKRIVTIGWYHSDQFQEGDSDDEPKSGYSYEYIQNIAEYNGWEYRYVYGDWSDLFGKFENGEIDLMAGVSKTPERMDHILFPNEYMGKEKYILYQHADNAKMDAGNIGTFAGKKIGAIRNNLMTDYLERWLSDHGAEPETVYYDSFDERDADFAAGSIDGIVSTDNNVMLTSGYSQVARVGEESYYLAVTGTREDLLEELNQAISSMNDIEPYFLNNLEYECYGQTMAGGTLTAAETGWLDNHSSITIGYLEDYAPYCSTDGDGNVHGLLTDVVEASLKSLRIDDRVSVSYRAYSGSDDMIAALKDGLIDAAFPVGGTTWQLEEAGIKASEDVITSQMYLVYRGKYSDQTMDSVAVSRGNGMARNYIEANAPEAEIAEFDSIEECLNGVLAGRASATVVNGLRIDLVKNNRKYSELSMHRLNKTDGKCFGVAAYNTALLMLLNRGLKMIGTDFGNNASYAYMSDLYSVSPMDYILDHMQVFGTLILLVVIVIMTILLWSREQTREYLKLEENKNQELTRKQAELEKATARANAANRAKTTFLFNMSHDIRTPMNAIMGYAELLEQHEAEPVKRKDYIAKIRTSGEMLLALINNVLEMARIESGESPLKETPYRAGRILADISDVYSELMQKKNIRYECSTERKTEYIYGDQVKLREIFLNIISNAYKYTPEGGSITVRTEELPSDRPGFALFRTTFADTGIGMSEEYLPKLFDEFSREKNATESGIQGTGLGMPIVKKLVDQMGGTLTVESRLGEGTTFTLILSHRIADAPEEAAGGDLSADEMAGLEGKRILLAEDNDFNAEIAMETLEDYGFLPERAENGRVCVDMLSKAPAGYYDLILMDVQMPEMGGYEATRLIRAMEDPARAEIPILAMTANAFESDRQDAMDAGMDGHLTKPVSRDKLVKVLKQVLS